MALHVNKVFNVSKAWEKIQSVGQCEFAELSQAFSHIEQNVYFLDESIREPLEFLLSQQQWKILKNVGGVANFKAFHGAPKLVSFSLRKGIIGVDAQRVSPYHLDSWITFKAKNATSLGLVPILCFPLADERIPRQRMTFEYAMERSRFIDIVEGNNFLMLGYSDRETALEIIDADSVIQRAITFEPHQLQAGVGLLSYFSEILKQKYSDSRSKISIEQDGQVVRLIIKTESGCEHKVEALLDEYAQILSGQLLPESFIDDQIQQLALRNKLDMAAMEVKHYQELLALTKMGHEQRVTCLELQVSNLKQIVSEGLASHRTAQELIGKLVANYGKSNEIELQLLELAKKMDERASDITKEEMERILKLLEDENTNLAQEFLGLLKGPLEGVAGNIIYSWLPHLQSILGSVVR